MILAPKLTFLQDFEHGLTFSPNGYNILSDQNCKFNWGAPPPRPTHVVGSGVGRQTGRPLTNARPDDERPTRRRGGSGEAKPPQPTRASRGRQPPQLKPTNERTNERTNEPNNQPTNQRTNERTNEPTNQQTNEPDNQTTNEPTNQRTNEQTNERTNQPTNRPTSISHLLGFLKELLRV